MSHHHGVVSWPQHRRLASPAPSLSGAGGSFAPTFIGFALSGTSFTAQQWPSVKCYYNRIQLYCSFRVLRCYQSVATFESGSRATTRGNNAVPLRRCAWSCEPLFSLVVPSLFATSECECAGTRSVGQSSSIVKGSERAGEQRTTRRPSARLPRPVCRATGLLGPRFVSRHPNVHHHHTRIASRVPYGYALLQAFK